MGLDENVTLFDLYFARYLQASRFLLWASEIPGQPDLGSKLMDRGKTVHAQLSFTNLWSDDEEHINPVIIKPGAYRNICVEIEIHDLAIAALTDLSYESMFSSNSLSNKENLSSLLENGGKDSLQESLQTQKTAFGDELSCVASFQVLRVLVQSWLNSAYSQNSVIANNLLHNLYRLISSQVALLHDPALLRLLQSLMRSTFFRLLGELQRLGATIVSASFNRVIIATNKTDLSAAQEYTDFIISTIKRSHEELMQGEGLGRISLLPNTYWTHFMYLDEVNYGGIRFESRELEEGDNDEWSFEMNGNFIVPTVVSGWNIMQYLASFHQQEYFRAIVARFSKDIYRKQIQLDQKYNDTISHIMGSGTGKDKKRMLISPKEELVKYTKKLISNHFSTYLTRVVGEILKEGETDDSFPKLPGSHLQMTSPALEFVKNVLEVLQLDNEVEAEVHLLKKSLLAQIGVQEYAEEVTWKNPCANFVINDVFCSECNECRDLNLCVIAQGEESEDNVKVRLWNC